MYIYIYKWINIFQTRFFHAEMKAQETKVAEEQC